MNLALQLTLFRVVLIPLFLLIYFIPFPGNNWVAFAVFVVASVTDFFDGWIARSFNQETTLGAFLDPVADKILISVILISVLTKHSDGLLGLYLMICTIIIIGRELLISALREFMAQRQVRNAVAVKFIGKVKTTAQIFALGFLIVYEHAGWIPTWEIGYLLLGLASFLTVWSMMDYFVAAFKALAAQGEDLLK